MKGKVDKDVEIIVYLQSTSECKNKFGNEWVDLVVSDVTGTTTFKMWAEAMAKQKVYPTAYIGTVVKVIGKVDFWQNRAGINVSDIKPAEEGEYSLFDIFPSLAEEERTVLADRYLELLGKMNETPLKTLVMSFFTKKRLMKMTCMHGGTDHHRYFGGLLLHAIETAEIAVAEAERYMRTKRPYEERIDLDLVIAGALFHDVGKLTTLSDSPDGKLSDRGFLVDTATESVLVVTTLNSAIKAEKRVADLAMLDHCILMAPTYKEDARPRTMEALIVRNANFASIQMDAYSLAFHNDKKKRDGGKIAYSATLGNYMVRGGMMDGNK